MDDYDGYYDNSRHRYDSEWHDEHDYDMRRRSRRGRWDGSPYEEEYDVSERRCSDWRTENRERDWYDQYGEPKFREDRRIPDRDEETNTLIVKGIPDNWSERDMADVLTTFLTSRISGEYLEGAGVLKAWLSLCEFHLFIAEKILLTWVIKLHGEAIQLSKEFHSVNLASSAMDGWFYSTLCEAGLDEIICDFAQPVSNKKSSDWTCTLCHVRNFARNNEVRALVEAYGPVSDVQCSQDHRDSAQTAYITFVSVQDAEAAQVALNRKSLPGVSRRLTVTIVPDRSGSDRHGDGNAKNLALEAVAAATAMNSYQTQTTVAAKDGPATDGWQPRSFSLDALDRKAEASGSAVHSTTDAPDGALQSGFVYDEGSGYYYDATSGYFYDSKSQLYYHPTTNSWYRQNTETGGFDTIPATDCYTTECMSSQTHSSHNKCGSEAGGNPRSCESTETKGAIKSSSNVRIESSTSVDDQKKWVKEPKKATALVGDFLKRKAEEQRQAAKDFLQKGSTITGQDTSGKLAKTPRLGLDNVNDTSLTLGVIRQKVYSTSQSHLETDGQDLPIANVVHPQSVSGGVIRGKSYSRRT